MSKPTTNVKAQHTSRSDGHVSVPSTCVANQRSHHRNRASRVIIGPGRPDKECLASAVREWLVPELVREFFCERGLEVPQRRNRSISPNSNYRTPLQGARVQDRVDKTR